MRVRMLERREVRQGDGFVAYEKDSLWNVADVDGEALIAWGAAIAEPDIVQGAVRPFITVLAETESEIILGVSVALSPGVAFDDENKLVARLETVSGVTLLEGARVGDYTETPAEYRFRKGAGSGVVVFQAQRHGCRSETASTTIVPARPAPQEG